MGVAGVLVLFTFLVFYILRKPLFDIGYMEDKVIDFS